MNDQERNEVIEEIARFVETHYCVIDVQLWYPHYKTFERTKHPAEPLAAAIRGMKK